jgi:hypothetical protein
MLTNNTHYLHTTLEIIDWKENPVNTDRVTTVPITETFRDIALRSTEQENPCYHSVVKLHLPLS